MAWRVTVKAAAGKPEVIDLPSEWHENPAVVPTACEVAAQFTRLLAEEHRAAGGTPEFVFRPPLTLRFEEVE